MRKISNKEMVRIEKRLKKDSKNLTHITDKSELSVEDRMKLNLCKQFVRYGNSKKMPLKDLAKLVGVPVQRMSEITNYKIKIFKIDKLIEYLTYLSKHDSKIKEFLNLLEQTTDIRAPSALSVRKIAREITELSASL
jgi:predicted XRE-type DNA-binding protein